MYILFIFLLPVLPVTFKTRRPWNFALAFTEVLTQFLRPGMPGLRLEHLENIHDRITEGLNQGFGKITDRLDALDPAGLFSRDQTFIRFNSFEHRVNYFQLSQRI